MQKLLFAVAVLLLPSSAVTADSYVRGYTTRNGTYVQPHYRSNSDGNAFNNYSTRGNTNPYTGESGYKDPYKTNNSFGSSGSSSYGLYGSQRR